MMSLFSLLVALAAAALWLHCRQQLRSQTVILHGSRIELQKTQRATLILQTQLQALQKQARELQQQDAALQQQAEMLLNQTEIIAGRQQELESRDVGQLTYAHASRLASGGAAQQDLINSCGLSPAEARLLELMHRRSSAAA